VGDPAGNIVGHEEAATEEGDCPKDFSRENIFIQIIFSPNKGFIYRMILSVCLFVNTYITLEGLNRF
jgi:hypothetical protein